MKTKPKINLKTKQQLLLEMEKLRTRLDATERRLQEANELLQAQIAEQRKPLRKLKNTLRASWKQYVNLLIVLTPDLRVITANRSFYETFHVTPKETEGRFIYSIGDHAWDIPAFFLLQGNGFFDKLLQAQKIK